MNALQHSPLSLAGQIALLIPVVAAGDQQKAREQQARAEIIAKREAHLKMTRAILEQQHLEAVLAKVRECPGVGTCHIARLLDYDRSFTQRKLLQLEAEGKVVQVGTGRVNKWEATK